MEKPIVLTNDQLLIALGVIAKHCFETPGLLSASEMLAFAETYKSFNPPDRDCSAEIKAVMQQLTDEGIRRRDGGLL